MDIKNLLSDAGKISLRYQKWEKEGDFVAGVLVDRRKNPTPNKFGHLVTEYILLTEEGERVCVNGQAYPRGKNKQGVDYKIIFGMSEIPLGAKMAFVFTSSKPTDLGNAAKIIEPRYIGERDEKVLADYQAKFGGATADREIEGAETPSDEIQVDEIPFN